MSAVPIVDTEPSEGLAARKFWIDFVTGAAQDIGLTTVERLTRDGFRVVAMDRDAEMVTQQTELLASLRLDVIATTIDMCDAMPLFGRWRRNPASTPWSAPQAFTTTPRCST